MPNTSEEIGPTREAAVEKWLREEVANSTTSLRPTPAPAFRLRR
jgi:hypothetical protein